MDNSQQITAELAELKRAIIGNGNYKTRGILQRLDEIDNKLTTAERQQVEADKRMEGQIEELRNWQRKIDYGYKGAQWILGFLGLTTGGIIATIYQLIVGSG